MLQNGRLTLIVTNLVMSSSVYSLTQAYSSQWALVRGAAETLGYVKASIDNLAQRSLHSTSLCMLSLFEFGEHFPWSTCTEDLCEREVL